MKFTFKTAEELSAMDDNQRATYHNAMKAHLENMELELAKKATPEEVKSANKEEIEALKKELSEMKETAKTQGAELTAMKENAGKVENSKKTFKQLVKEALTSERFKEYTKRGFTGKSGEIELKTVDLTADYTGNVIMISSTSQRVLDEPANRRLNIRDIMPVMPTDNPNHTFPEVYDWDKNVAMEAENGTLNESAFKVRENSIGTKRLGTYIKISKRMLKSVSWLVYHLSSKLPDALKFVEDFQILFGDGAGNNLSGICKNATAFDLTYATYAGGAFSSIAGYDGTANTLATFAAVHGLKNGDILSVASSTGATYDGDHIVNVVNSTQVLLNQAYTADAGIANWTATAKNALYFKIDNPQEIDVIIAAIAILSRGEYFASGVVLNPMQMAIIRTLKATDDNYIKGSMIEVRNGITYIANVPIVETNAMPAGYFLVGDFQKAIELLEFTAMTLEFADDVSYKLNNEVAAIISEEVILPIYNKYMFIYGSFASAITELTKP